MPALGAGDEGDAQFFRQFEAHVGGAVAGYQHRDAHQRRLHDDFRCQPPGGVENLVLAADVVQPHLTRDRVHGVVPAHVLDECQDLPAPAQPASVHRARGAVGLVVVPDLAQHVVDVRLPDFRRRQAMVVQLVQGAAEDRSLAAARGHRALAGVNAGDALALPGFHLGNLPVPVHRDRADLGGVVEQGLVPQVAQHQQLRPRAEGHQGHQLLAVHLDGQGDFSHDVDVPARPELVQRRHPVDRLQPGVAETRPARRGRGRGVLDAGCRGHGRVG